MSDRPPESAGQGPVRRTLARAISPFLPESIREVPDLRHRAELLVFGSAALSLVGLAVALAVFSKEGLSSGFSMIVLGCSLVAVAPLLLRWTGKVTWIGGYVTALMLLSVFSLGVLRHGFHGGALWFTPIIPLAATFFVGPRAGALTTALSVVLLVAVYNLVAADAESGIRTFFAMLGACGATTLVGVLSWEYESARHTAYRLAESAMADLRHRSHELEDARDDAQAGSAAKSRFLANMSHELRTPLNGLVGMSALLTETELTREQREYVTSIQTSTDSLMGLIKDILDFSKIEAGRLEIEDLPVDVWKLVEDVAELNAEPAHRRGVEVTALLPRNLPDRVMTDPGRLRQVLMNLVSNAVKFTESGEVTIRVSAEERPRPEVTLRFEVTDTGIGIAPDKLERLWDPFAQADESTTRRFGGTGLGLSISRQIVEAMDGTLGVESRPGKGSRFWFTVDLPVVRGSSGGDLPVLQQLGGQKVLVVERNRTREQLGQLLDGWAMRWECVASEREAQQRIAAAANQPFDLLIIDAGLSGDLEKSVEQMRRRKGTPVVLLTTRVSAPHRWARSTEGVWRLLKPVRRHGLHQVIALALGLRKPAQLQPLNTPTEPSGARILVAEDHPINQQVARRVLERLGYRVEVASTGEEAAQIADPSRHAAILMDCHMPVMDGYEATRTIRSREGAGTSIPIIAMTASALTGDRERCLSAGMNDYISKPVTPETLAQVLGRWTHHHAMEEPLFAEAPSQGPVDLEVLRRLAGDADNAFMAHMVRVYLDDAPARVRVISSAFEAGNAETLSNSAHSLKSASAAMGAERLASICAAIEQQALTGQLDSLSGQIGDLREEFEQVAAALERVKIE